MPASESARRAFAGDPALVDALISEIRKLPPEDLPLLHMVLVGLAADPPLAFNTTEEMAAVPVRNVETKRQANGDVSLNAVTDSGREWSLRMHGEASQALIDALATVVGSEPSATAPVASEPSVGRWPSVRR